MIPSIVLIDNSGKQQSIRLVQREMPLEGHNLLEKISEGGLLDGEQFAELDVDSVRKFVAFHFQKDASSLRHIEQLIIRSEAKLSRNELRLLFIFYLELLRCVKPTVEHANIYMDPTVRQFLRQFRRLLTEEENLNDEVDHKWVQLLLGETVCEMFVEMNRQAEGSTSPFCYDNVKHLVSALLADESTRIARRSAIEHTAIAMLHLFDAKGSAISLDGSLFSCLVHTLVQADYFIVVESISRVLGQQNEIWRDVRRTDGHRRTILHKATQTQRIGPAFAELLATLYFTASVSPTNDLGFEDQHGFLLVLAKLAKLLADDTVGCCSLDGRTVFDLLATNSKWNLGLIGPLLPQYSQLYSTESLLLLLRSLIPSLISRDQQPCADSAISTFVDTMLGTDSLMELIPGAFEQLIPHLLDPRLSAHNFFCIFCGTMQKQDPDCVFLQKLFTIHPNLGAQLADLVSSSLIGDTTDHQCQWELEHSALELMNVCRWIVPKIPNRSALNDFLIRCAMNESNSFLCGPAVHILCKHFPSETVQHWQHIYEQNFDSAEVKFDLLLYILQSVGGTLSSSFAPSDDENNESNRLAIVKSAAEVLDTMEQMLEDEDAEQCLQKGTDLCTELIRCMPSTDEGERDRYERRKMAFTCRQEELLWQKQWRYRDRQREDLCAMVENLVPVMSSGCSVTVLGNDEPISKDCY